MFEQRSVCHCCNCLCARVCVPDMRTHRALLSLYIACDEQTKRAHTFPSGWLRDSTTIGIVVRVRDVRKRIAEMIRDRTHKPTIPTGCGSHTHTRTGCLISKWNTIISRLITRIVTAGLCACVWGNAMLWAV